MATGWVHIIVGFCFLLGAVAVDIDHVRTCSFSQLKEAFNGNENDCHRGLFHNPVIFWCLLALTIGLFIHLKLDGVL